MGPGMEKRKGSRVYGNSILEGLVCQSMLIGPEYQLSFEMFVFQI